jgi:cell division protein FtsQ
VSTERPGEERRWQMVRGGRVPAARFAARSRRRRFRGALPYLVVLVVLAVAGGLGWAIYGTTLFAARTVRIEGAHTVPPAEVARVAAVPSDVPLAQLDTRAVVDRVRKIAVVADARVVRSWPGTVTVVVTERVGVAVQAKAGQYVLIDVGGVPFRTVPTRPPNLPLVELASPGPRDRPTAAALAVALALTDGLRGKLVKIAAPTPSQVTLYLAGGRTVFWGDAENSDRKATVTTALLNRPGKRIDVSAPDVVTVR